LIITKEKQPWLEFYMEGWSWSNLSFMAGHADSPERKGRGRRGVGEGTAGYMEREKWAP
jgi:hypothetical protein